jgi:UDP-N-acetylglucosamine 1-carboxyvinyltransferase
MIPAVILAGEPCIIENLPIIEDVHVLTEILRHVGADIELNDNGCMRIDPTGIDRYEVTFEMASKMRASYYMLGAMLGRYGKASLALPGGCPIGERPINFHIKGMRALGANVEIRNGIVYAEAEKLYGAEIYLDMASVGATINIMLAACRAEGTTVIVNAAKEPHVVDVANFLNMMGASIKGAGTDIIRIKGVSKLHGCNYAIIPDQIETGTFMIAAAATQGDVILQNVIPTHLEAVSAKLMESGARVIEGDDGRDFFLRVTMNDRPRAVSFRTMVYPGFPTDLQQPMMAYLSTAGGTSVITENIFEKRFNHVRELRKLGASISISKRVARVKGVENLRGADIFASDLRAGAALIVAGLMAGGETRVHNIGYIDRGYEYLDSKFRAIGADILRVDEE